MLIDQHRRQINYLRISVTDKCNLRCRYCMPEQGVPLKSHQGILRWEELLRLTSVLTKLGIDRVRITGGEPLVRKGLLRFIENLSTQGFQDISLTTNGIMLTDMAKSLKSAGVSRINISLDSLDPETYAWITRGGDVNKVMTSIDAALEADLHPVKINTVVVRGLNDHEVSKIADLTRTLPVHVRFIELMPVGNHNWGDAGFVPTAELVQRLQVEEGLIPAQVQGNGPAQVWKFKGSPGTVGFISAMSEHICGACNRIRLTADGRLYPCLHGEKYVDLLSVLRTGTSNDVLEQIAYQAIVGKPARYHMGTQQRHMNALGG